MWNNIFCIGHTFYDGFTIINWSVKVNRMTKNIRAYTLVEFISVLAIILFLSGILFSSVFSVRESTRRTSCMTNMMQLTHAMSNYLSDYDDTYPRVFSGVFVHEKKATGTKSSGRGF